MDSNLQRPYCLNRTSVGLKQRCLTHGGVLDKGLNRTSVGLKPPLPPPPAHTSDCLNRTSVGLKQVKADHNHEYLYQASIEPAWD